MEDRTRVWLFVAGMIPAGALAGFAALLRSDEKMTAQTVAAAALNSGLFAGAFCALMFGVYGPENELVNVGMSILAGLGGNTTVGFALNVWRSWLKSQTTIRENK